MLNHLKNFSAVLSLLLAAAALTGCSSSAPGTYATPEEAATAFADAARSGLIDKMQVVLGKEGVDLIASDDPISDRKEVEAFLAAYDESHQVVAGKDGERSLVVGSGNWPFPVPIVQEKGRWRFDVESGREELFNRRIGRNELNAIEVSRTIAGAQHDYAHLLFDDTPQYAQKIVSDKGTRNGLYWETKPDEEPSPLGPMLAAATDEGYRIEDLKSGKTSYYGYRYRILKSQGPDAPGGEREYIYDGKMIGGFAVLAQPSEYGVTGVMSFLVSHDGTVYEADLGPETTKITAAITAFNPDAKWKQVATQEPAPATQP